MNPARIADLLQPFMRPISPNSSNKSCHSEQSEESALPTPASPNPCHSEQSEESAVLTPAQLQQISTYIDLLLRWNARINLTAIRNEEEIITRHFGESLFTARHLFRNTWEQPPSAVPAEQSSATLIDVGSGAGFPGLPIKILFPEMHVTLIESNQKKATFLREVIRALTLTNINVFEGRAETYPNQAETVILRAVEQFNDAISIAISLVRPGGRMATLIGNSQLENLRALTPTFTWSKPIQVPSSSNRVLATGRRNH
jgi:16S rRNA (guanine527-N7)-methyltransferase